MKKSTKIILVSPFVLLLIFASVLGVGIVSANQHPGTANSTPHTTSATPTIRNTTTVQPTKAVPVSGKLSTQAPEFSQTNILLALSKGISRQQRVIIERSVHAHEVRSLGIDNAYLVTVPSGHVLNAVRTLRTHAGVRYAEPDYTQIVAAVPNDPAFPTQWAYQNTGQTVNGTSGTPGADERATPAWDVTTGSSSIVIGEVDTGVDYTHPDLAPNIWNNPGGIGGCPAGTHGYNTLTATCDPMDDDAQYGGHGTHVAGIMGAAGNNGVGVTGVNWHTTILPVKWVTSNGSGATSDLITSLNWLLQAKQAGVNIRVINDSTVFVGTAYSQALSDEIDLLGQNGILFVTAAGNTGDNNDNLSVRRYPCGYDRPTELCVAASDQNDTLPSWANYGPHTVDLAAPGNNIYSTLLHHTYGFINGSSMASPQVAGAAALILSVQDMPPVQLKADILNNVDQLPSLQGLLITGGRLNICKALPGCILPPSTPTPTSTPTSPPTSGTFGLTSVGANADMMVPDTKRATKATLAVSGNVYKLTMYLAPTGVSGQQVMEGILYADQGGSAGTLLGGTNALTFFSTNAAGWYDMQFPSPIALTPGTYWIGVLSGNTNHVAGFRWNSVSQIRAVNSNSYASGPSSPFGTATIDAEQMSIFASYTLQNVTPTPTPTPTSTSTPTPTSTPTSSAYRSAVLADQPGVYYRLDEASGTTAADSSGNGHNGTYTTNATLGQSGATNDGDTAISGSGRLMQYSAGTGLPAGTATFSVEAWFETTATPASPWGSTLVSWGTESGNGLLALMIYSSSQMKLSTWSNDYYFPVPAGASAIDGKWHYVVATFDGSNGTMYYDGQSLGTQPVSLNIVMNSTGLVLGSATGNNDTPYSGLIDEVAIYTRVLSASRVQTHYNSR